MENYKTFSEETLCAWYNRVSDRIDYLLPLVQEIEKSGNSLNTINKELNQEWIHINGIKNILDVMKR